jgi:hypothetical protein
MPTPRPNESESDYVSRCVPYVMKNEGATQDQALGKCYGMYRNYKKGARKRAQHEGKKG